MAEPVVSNKTCNIQRLQEVLCKFWNKKVVVAKADIVPATAKGNNFVSDAWRVHFNYEEEDGKESHSNTVIVKTQLENKAANELMHTKIAFLNEIHAYEKVIPTLQKYSSSPLRVPAYFYGDESCIVLEDMHKKSFRFINKKLAVQWNQVWSPIQEMAKLHAASLVMQKLNKTEFDELVKNIRRVSSTESTPLGEKQATVIDTILKILEDTKTEEAAKYKKAIQSLKQGVWKEQENIINKEVPIRVINHGSIWVNNLLYRSKMITLLDWQHIVYSSPATDLSYFLYVNLDSDFLSYKRKQLINFYLLNLHQSVYDAAVNRMSDSELGALLSSLNYEWIDGELKRCSLYAYMMSQWITPVFYWSEATFLEMEARGGFETMSVEERLRNITIDGKYRIIELTKLYFSESMPH